MFSKRQLQTISIVPHFTAGLSLVGSSTLVGYLCLYDRNQHGEILDSTHKRLMLGLSIFDFLGSIGFFLSTWPIDKDTVYGENGEKRNEYVFGNDQTCQIQGFLIQLAISAALYNVMIALNCLMVTHYRIAYNTIAAKYEMYMHGVAITFGIGVAIACIPLHLYNNSALWCWISSDIVNDSDGNDVGGVKENYWRSFRFLFYYGPAWLSAIIITAMMYFFLKIIWMLNNSRHFMSLSGQKKIDRQIRAHTNQVIFLIFAFYLTYIPGTINRFYDLTDTMAPFWLVLLHTIFAPLQGFFNAMVYARPRLMKKYRTYVKRRKRLRRSLEAAKATRIESLAVVNNGIGSENNEKVIIDRQQVEEIGNSV